MLNLRFFNFRRNRASQHKLIVSDCRDNIGDNIIRAIRQISNFVVAQIGI
jgi:hypothetical protein